MGTPDADRLDEFAGLLSRNTLGTVLDANWETAHRIFAPRQ